MNGSANCVVLTPKKLTVKARRVQSRPQLEDYRFRRQMLKMDIKVTK